MIDIHSHMIFGVDDGPKTLEESLELIDDAYKKGIKKIIATSHRRKGMFETPEQIIQKNFNTILENVKNKYDDLVIYYGAEIYYTLDIVRKLENREIPTLANTDYVLVEFSSNVSKRDILKAIDSVLILGLKPIIAHLERYNISEDNNLVESIINKGAYIQVNAASILKPKLFGDKEKIYKKRAKNLLKNDFVHFVASDMHNLATRKNYLNDAYDIISRNYGEKVAQEVIINNQEKLINNILI
ncbi:CpsB/CapC family capsule biosynthesis tyrosine phosphatase [Gemelliphila palaticanis]|uniref:Tyrosine-protein phosphatase n=1 Tax=Gemelliphila palaticanis TaxID=81950 RepID=A0ABX2T1J8_9BACL|nr:CpsB/CapC family capsule biosynthesis tyrosine phosphatase [Gemella palaticanis]MBF0715603.1 tyrosine protein phosphatase [Gemella palaticanis]NYS47533.1 tyrosine protein phosphatase [Gemella palaticanis]